MEQVLGSKVAAIAEHNKINAMQMPKALMEDNKRRKEVKGLRTRMCLRISTQCGESTAVVAILQDQNHKSA